VDVGIESVIEKADPTTLWLEHSIDDDDFVIKKDWINQIQLF